MVEPTDNDPIAKAVGIEIKHLYKIFGSNPKAMLPLVKEQGVELRQFSDEIYDSFYEASQDVFEGVRSHSPLAKKIDDSFRAARTDLAGWTKISDQAYLAQRNRVLGA